MKYRFGVRSGSLPRTRVENIVDERGDGKRAASMIAISATQGIKPDNCDQMFTGVNKY
jgi:hypothetical protein